MNTARSEWITRFVTVATTGVGCWSHVAAATFSSCVREPGFTTSAANVIVSASPAAKVRFVASQGGSWPAAAFVPGPTIQALSATYSVPVGSRSSIRMPVWTTSVRLVTPIVYVTTSPGRASPTTSDVLKIRKPATTAAASAASFSATGSGKSAAETQHRLVSVRPSVLVATVAVSSKVAAAPTARSPTVQMPLPAS